MFLAHFAGSCHRKAPPALQPTDAGLSAAIRPRSLPWAATRTAPQIELAATLTAESPLQSPPAAPVGCSLDGPVRSLPLATEAVVAFATAASGARTLLALSTAQSSALWMVTGDGTLESLVPPFGAHSPVVAAGLSRGLAVAGTIEHASEQRETRLGLVGDNGQRLLFGVARRYRGSVVDLACSSTRDRVCVLAIEGRDEFAIEDELRGEFREFAFSTDDSLVERSVTRTRQPPLGAAVDRSFMGLVRERGAVASVDRRGQIVGLGANVTEAQAVDGAWWLVRALAPTVAPCQPSQWQLRSENASERMPSVDAANLDQRPSRVKLRWSGSRANEALLVFRSSPQCAANLQVLEAVRQGQRVTLSRASEFDLAVDHALVSLVWRDGERLRWARYRCE